MTELTRDLDIIHEFTDFATFAKAVEGAVLLNLEFHISTELRKDDTNAISGWGVTEGVVEVRYWLITVH